MHTLSFAILDDLEPIFMRSLSIEHIDFETIKTEVTELIHEAFIRDNTDDPTYLFRDYATGKFICRDRLITYISSDLANDGFYVLNRVEKYYVVAFAIDYTRFEVYSKDCDKKLIDWGHDTTQARVDGANSQYNGAIKGIIYDPDYNMNPVLKYFSN